MARQQRAQPAKEALDVAKPEVVWACRVGFERYLAAELSHARVLEPGLVATRGWGQKPPAFGRMGFALTSTHGLDEPPTSEWFSGIGPAHLQVWTVDSDLANRKASLAAQWAESLTLPQGLASADAAKAQGALLAQLCVGQSGLYVGQVLARDAVSLAPGGRHRMRRPLQSPSRASMKLEEALEWLGLEPVKGEICVDLGAAPGGWTQRLIARGARVIAVDPARLSPELSRDKKVRHVQASAFAFAPDEPVDWLFCDMAWRPLEVAQLIAKWGRNRWAFQFVANFKLPMKDKLPIIARIRSTLEGGGWRGLQVRQLYHDRDEVTATGRLLA